MRSYFGAVLTRRACMLGSLCPIAMIVASRSWGRPHAYDRSDGDGHAAGLVIVSQVRHRELFHALSDHLVGARDALQRLRDGLAGLASIAATTRATRRRRQDNRSRGRWLAAVANRLRAVNGRTVVLSGAALGLLHPRSRRSRVPRVASPTDQAAYGRVQPSAETIDGLHFGDQQFQMRRHRLRAEARASAARRACCSAASAARSDSVSEGIGSGTGTIQPR